MKLYSLKIKDSVFRVAVISEEEEMKKGLSGKPRLAPNRGLFFDFKESQDITMNMIGMNYSLDMIFINDNLEVIDVRTMRKGDIQTTCNDCRFVLEVSEGEGDGLTREKVKFTRELAEECNIAIKNKENTDEKYEEENHEKSSENIIITITVGGKDILRTGGSFKMYEDQVKAQEGSLQVLDDTGKVLMNLKGGERIFSIDHTEKLIALAKKIDLGEADDEELGKLMAKIIDTQNNQTPEYV